jgi:hypothetical protein
MSLVDEIIAVYPELTREDFDSITGAIFLFDDSDGQGAYITKWEYSKPLPNGMKVGK